MPCHCYSQAGVSTLTTRSLRLAMEELSPQVLKRFRRPRPGWLYSRVSDQQAGCIGLSGGRDESLLHDYSFKLTNPGSHRQDCHGWLRPNGGCKVERYATTHVYAPIKSNLLCIKGSILPLAHDVTAKTTIPTPEPRLQCPNPRIWQPASFPGLGTLES